MELIRKQLHSWNNRHDSFTKLQHAYAVLALLVFVIAGIISLVNYQLGQSMLFIALCSLMVFIANGVVWALIRTFLIPAEQKSVPKRKS